MEVYFKINRFKEVLSPGPLDDYLSLEYQIIDLISASQDVSWKLEKQELITKEGRRYDKLIVAVKGINGNPMPLVIENHCFDITDCDNVL